MIAYQSRVKFLQPGMHCPAGDGQLHIHSTTNSNGLTLSYGLCASCSGHWMNGFDANYITTDTIKDPKPTRPIEYLNPLHCPVCNTTLDHAHEDSMVPGVTLYKCSVGHGYFFPPGEFSKFKLGQSSKISYFKLWQIPFGSPAATLLAVFTGLILSVGLVVGVIGGQQTQVMTSKAAEIVSFQKAYVSGSTVTILATTTKPTMLQVHVPKLDGYAGYFESVDGTSHVRQVKDVIPGTYTYYITFQIDDKQLRTEEVTFIVK